MTLDSIVNEYFYLNKRKIVNVLSREEFIYRPNPRREILVFVNKKKTAPLIERVRDSSCSNCIRFLLDLVKRFLSIFVKS